MDRRNRSILCAALILVAFMASGCGSDKFQEPMSFAGQEVSAEVLNLGEETYMVYCRACHGVNGDGNGPASKGLRPPPRDFRQGVYKFVAVESGYLPNDEDFRRIIRHGLEGTAMLPWDISDARLEAVIQYIKTFSEKWQDEYEEVGEVIEPDGEDPFGPSRKAEAIAEGAKLYHALAQCMSCHPAYATYEEIYEFGEASSGSGRSDLSERIYTPELKDSDYGVKILPTDFTFHRVRSGSGLIDYYRTIASGIGGTAMPTWKGSISDEQIWAMAYYVQELVQMRDTPAARQLRQKLENQEPFTPPEEG